MRQQDKKSKMKINGPINLNSRQYAEKAQDEFLDYTHIPQQCAKAEEDEGCKSRKDPYNF